MRNQIKFILSLTILVALVIACGNTSKKNTSKSQLTYHLTGTGTKTQKVTLNEGLAIFDYSGDDEKGHYSIWLKYSNGKNFKLIANQIGGKAGSVSVNIPEDDTYVLDVTSEGYWGIYIK